MRKIFKLFRQEEKSECGLACIAMVAAYHGSGLDLADIRARFPVSLRGSNTAALLTVAERLELDARAMRVDIDELRSLRLPAILHWNFDHFVVLTGIRSGPKGIAYRIADPNVGERTVKAAELSARFTGVCIEITPSIELAPKPNPPKLRIQQLWTRLQGIKRTAAQVLCLSIIIQAAALISPIYLKIGVDAIAQSRDDGLLLTLALIFASIKIAEVFATYVRSMTVLSMSTEFGFQLTQGILKRTSRLPIPWFEKRSVGDVLSRFTASQGLVDFLTSGLVQAVVDGFLSIATLSLMIIYSPNLAIICFIANVICLFIRLSTINIQRSRNINLIRAQAREQSNLIETVRGISTIRCFGGERLRLDIWKSRKSDVYNAQVEMMGLQNVSTMIVGIVLGLEGILSIYLGISAIISETMTAGTLFAFILYRAQFSGAASSLIGKFLDFKLLDAQLGRLNDVVLTQEDPGVGPPPAAETDISSVGLKDIWHSYGAGEPYILKGVSFEVFSGQSIAIVGVSGSGKTTLLKVILGLVQPTSGSILINGRPIRPNEFGELRAVTTTVTQDDLLFSGTIGENICFFDTRGNTLERIVEAAKLAHIHQDIVRMPLGYETLVGDMGSSLSGGQRQRIMLARALYRKPHVLILDEATAHLDLTSEAAVTDTLKNLNIIRIIVAHRPETIRMADRRASLINGQLVEIADDSVSSSVNHAHDLQLS